MNVFVSYSRRDGFVNMTMLTNLHKRLSETSEPFIHAIEEPNLKHQQLAVLMALFRCNLIVLLVSPASEKSPWVWLEIFLGRLLMRPIITIDAQVFSDWR